MGNDEIKEVIIATTDVQQALYIIAKNAVMSNELEIRYTEKYAPTVEYILRILRKGFGWMESERGRKNTVNNRCQFNKNNYCTNPKIGCNKLCTENVRSACKEYVSKFEFKSIEINYVVIEKVGQIRNM